MLKIEKINNVIVVKFNNIDRFNALITEPVKDELKSFHAFKIELCPMDYKNKEKISSIITEYLDEKPVEFFKSDQDFNGGMIITDMNEEMKLDLSLKSIILRNKVFIGNQVQRLLDQKSDLDE